MSDLWIKYTDNGFAYVTEEGKRQGCQVIQVPNARNGGGTYGTGNPKITLHEIIGNASYSMISGHPYPPQVWLQVPTRVLFQTIPLTRSGFALEAWNKAGPNFQVELSGYSDYVPNEPDWWLDVIAEMAVAPICDFSNRIYGPINLDHWTQHDNLAGAASYDWPGRMTVDEYVNWDGVAQHTDAPDNSHWDCGAMRLGRIAGHSQFIIADKLVTRKRLDSMDHFILVAGTGSYFACYAGRYFGMTGAELQNAQQRGIPNFTVSQGEWADLGKMGRVL